MNNLTVPKQLLAAMSYEGLQRYLRQFKRTRRQFVGFTLNGHTTFLPRKEAVALVEATLQQVEAR